MKHLAILIIVAVLIGIQCISMISQAEKDPTLYPNFRQHPILGWIASSLFFFIVVELIIWAITTLTN